MKKMFTIVLCALLLAGCSAEVYETVDDELLQQVMAPAGELAIELPKSAAEQVMQSEKGEKLYFCDGYVLTVQTLKGGDMEKTVKSLCGFSTGNLPMVETVTSSYKRRDWVWTCAGEGGDQIGRAAVLDDGRYHYCVTVMADASAAGGLEQQWNELFGSLDIG